MFEKALKLRDDVVKGTFLLMGTIVLHSKPMLVSQLLREA